MPLTMPPSFSRAVERPARVAVDTNRGACGNSARNRRTNSIRDSTSPTETACNQMAPGTVCVKVRRGKKTNRWGGGEKKGGWGRAPPRKKDKSPGRARKTKTPDKGQKPYFFSHTALPPTLNTAAGVP